MDQSKIGTMVPVSQEEKRPDAAPAFTGQQWDMLEGIARKEIMHHPGYRFWSAEQRAQEEAKHLQKIAAMPHYQTMVAAFKQSLSQPQESREPSHPAAEPLILKTNSEGNPPEAESIEDYLKRLKSKDVTSTGLTIGITGMRPRSTTTRSNESVGEEKREDEKRSFDQKAWLGLSPTQILQKLVKTRWVKDATNPGTGLEIVGTSQRRPREYEES
jgi:hypothetical protein